MSGRRVRGALINGCSRWLSSAAPLKSNPKSISSSSSPLNSNIQRILRNEIQYKSDYAPPYQPIIEFDRFVVEDRPGEQWITLRGKTDEDENIKIEATMFDGSVIDHKIVDGDSVEELRLHISLLVDIWKGEGTDVMEFVCSAWPDSLEIRKVYVFKRGELPTKPCMGPDIRNLKPKLQTEFYEFLKTRGVHDGLSEFLHEYMMNKDKIELIQWLGRVESYFEK